MFKILNDFNIDIRLCSRIILLLEYFDNRHICKSNIFKNNTIQNSLFRRKQQINVFLALQNIHTDNSKMHCNKAIPFFHTDRSITVDK